MLLGQFMMTLIGVPLLKVMRAEVLHLAAGAGAVAITIALTRRD